MEPAVSTCVINRIQFSGKQLAKIEYNNLQLSICVLLMLEESIRRDNGRGLFLQKNKALRGTLTVILENYKP